MADESCKARIELGSEVEPGALGHVLDQAREIAARCGCHAVSLVFKPKDGFRTVTIGCLRGRRRMNNPGGA